jgi:nucleolar protein 14
MEKEHEEDIRHELDNEFAHLRDLLYAPDPSLQESSNAPASQFEGENAHPRSVDSDTKIVSLAPEAQDADYDRHVRELAFDKRSKPKDRTKTEEELALEEKEALEKAEEQRRKRMLGIEDDESEGEGRSKRKRKRGGDDLEDDFYEEEKDDWAGLGAGLGIEQTNKHMDEGEATSEGISEAEEDDGDEGSDTYSFDDDSRGAEDEEGEQENLTPSSAKTKLKSLDGSSKPDRELPYTFPAPVNHDEFLEIVMDVSEKDVPTVVHRIRTLYHTSLAPDNKFKLQVR